jgi:hypothetical protein
VRSKFLEIHGYKNKNCAGEKFSGAREPFLVQPTADFYRRAPAPSSISTPNTSSTMPQMRLMLMSSERWTGRDWWRPK